MGIQLVIDSFLIETLTERVVVKVRRAARQIARFIADRQLELKFTVKPEGLYEEYRQFDREKGCYVTKYREISFGSKSHGHVGSPVKMRKIKKDTPYLEGI